MYSKKWITFLVLVILKLLRDCDYELQPPLLPLIFFRILMETSQNLFYLCDFGRKYFTVYFGTMHLMNIFFLSEILPSKPLNSLGIKYLKYSSSSFNFFQLESLINRIKPSDNYSRKGTNCIGTPREIKDLKSFLSRNNKFVKPNLQNDQIEWIEL